MEHSNAYDRPSWAVARPLEPRNRNPMSAAIKDALPNLVGITVG
jgi:hypothetical protein